MADMSVQTTFSDAPAAGYAGMLDSNLDHDLITMVSSDAASMPFGSGLVFDPTPTTDKDATLPAAITDVPVGILAHSHNYAAVWTDVKSGNTYGELDSTGVKAGAFLNVLRKGRILVVCEDGCSPGDKLHIRALGGTKGALRAAADGTNTIDATANGTWLTTATAGNLAWLEVNF